MSPEQVQGVGRRSALGHLFVRGDPVRDAFGDEGVRAETRAPRPWRRSCGRAAGVVGVGAEHLVRVSTTSSGIAWRRTGTTGSKRPRTLRSPSRSSQLATTSGVQLAAPPARKSKVLVAVAARRRSGRRGCLSPAEAAPGRGRGRWSQARGRAAVREPGVSRGRLLRRRDRGRDSRQADIVAGPPSDRPGQLDALQENDQDAAADRRRARTCHTS